MDKKPNRTGFLPGQLKFGDDFDTLGQDEIESAFEGESDPTPATEPSLATKEAGEGQRCQVCDFPAIAGQVQGEIDGERYSLQICQSCLQHAVLCLRDSHRQCRLFDDDFEIEELCGFGSAKRPEAIEVLERVKKGDEQTFSSEQIRNDLGLNKDE